MIESEHGISAWVKEEIRMLHLADSYKAEIKAQNPKANDDQVALAAEQAAKLLLPVEDHFRYGVLPGFQFSSEICGLAVDISRKKTSESTTAVPDQLPEEPETLRGGWTDGSF